MNTFYWFVPCTDILETQYLSFFIIVTSWPTINKFETLLSKQNKKSYLEYFQIHLPCNELRTYIR